MATTSKGRTTTDAAFTIVQRREVATIVSGMGDLSPHCAAAVEIMRDYRNHEDPKPAEYEFTVPVSMDDAAANLDKEVTYTLALKANYA